MFGTSGSLFETRVAGQEHCFPTLCCCKNMGAVLAGSSVFVRAAKAVVHATRDRDRRRAPDTALAEWIKDSSARVDKIRRVAGHDRGISRQSLSRDHQVGTSVTNPSR